MTKFLFIPIIILTLISCGTYRYNQPTVNSALFKNENELQFSGEIGSSGGSIKTAYSFPNQIGFMAMYNGGISNYGVKEGEIGIGFYSNADPGGIFVVGGAGYGSNFKYTDSTHSNKYWEGEFIKPFVQFNGGITGGTIVGGLKGDLIFSFKATNFIYNGRFINSGNAIKSNYLLLEPAFTMGLGGRNFQFNFTFGVPITAVSERLNSTTNARTVPGNVSFGLRFFINRVHGDL